MAAALELSYRYVRSVLLLLQSAKNLLIYNMDALADLK